MTQWSALMAGLVMASLVSVDPAMVDAQALERQAEYTAGRPTGLQGPYLGQTVPGTEPQVFAPGLVSVAETGETAADMQSFARHYLSPGNRTVVRLLSETK